jgi:hypothetical protein
MATITAANSLFMLSIKDLYPVPVKIQGYATDDAVLTESAEMAQVVQGVDGLVSAAWVPFVTKQTISLQADSDSMAMFIDWVNAQKRKREVYRATGTILLRSINRSFDLVNGTLVMGSQIPDIKKILGPMKFNITWEAINPAPV